MKFLKDQLKKDWELVVSWWVYEGAEESLDAIKAAASAAALCTVIAVIVVCLLFWA